MNIPNTMMMKANSRFGAMRSEAGARPSWQVKQWWRSAMVRLAALGSRLLRMDRGGIVEIDLAVGVGRALVGVDGRARPTCRRGAGSAWQPISARGCGPARAARSW